MSSKLTVTFPLKKKMVPQRKWHRSSIMMQPKLGKISQVIFQEFKVRDYSILSHLRELVSLRTTLTWRFSTSQNNFSMATSSVWPKLFHWWDSDFLYCQRYGIGQLLLLTGESGRTAVPKIKWSKMERNWKKWNKWNEMKRMKRNGTKRYEMK